MPVYIQHIETIVPEHAYTQEFTATQLQSAFDDARQQRLVRWVCKNSGIETRHSVLGDFKPGAEQALFTRTGTNGRWNEPSTRERNNRFADESRRLCVSLARRVLEQRPDIPAADITHVITVTCTGFANPGPDYHVVREAGLRDSTQRYALGFMGCYAALPALRMATQFCQADPAAVVLVIAVELCSLHLNFGGDPASILPNAIFADGAAAAVVSAREPAPGRTAYRLGGFGSALVPSGERDMAWRIGDNGFDITLSSYVPDIIGANIRALVESASQHTGRGIGDVAVWAVHPGGKAILDKVQAGLGLGPEALRASREILRRYGNMSSATILFVLKELAAEASASEGDSNVFAMAFGPGLTVESARLCRCAGKSKSGSQNPESRSKEI